MRDSGVMAHTRPAGSWGEAGAKLGRSRRSALPRRRLCPLRVTAPYNTTARVPPLLDGTAGYRAQGFAGSDRPEKFGAGLLGRVKDAVSHVTGGRRVWSHFGGGRSLPAR